MVEIYKVVTFLKVINCMNINSYTWSLMEKWILYKGLGPTHLSPIDFKSETYNISKFNIVSEPEHANWNQSSPLKKADRS